MTDGTPTVTWSPAGGVDLASDGLDEPDHLHQGPDPFIAVEDGGDEFAGHEAPGRHDGTVAVSPPRTPVEERRGNPAPFLVDPDRDGPAGVVTPDSDPAAHGDDGFDFDPKPHLGGFGVRW